MLKIVKRTPKGKLQQENKQILRNQLSIYHKEKQTLCKKKNEE